MTDRAPELVLRTDLSVDECLARLGATGLRGRARPDRWQPTTVDLSILRKVDGHRFRMVNRLLERQRYRHGGFWYFRGEVEAVPGGTVVSGRWELAAAGRLELFLFAPIIALMAGALFARSLLGVIRGGGDATGAVVFGGLFLLLVAAIAWGGSVYRRKPAPTSRDGIAQALERLLGPREVDGRGTAVCARRT